MKSYLEFCDLVHNDPVPASPNDVALYIAYLVDMKKLKYASVRQYLCIITNLHKSNGLFDPVSDWNVSHILKGVKRELGDSQVGAIPVTPEHLLKLKNQLDVSHLLGASVWAACLIGFFGMLRPGNFLSGAAFDPTRNITVNDVVPVSRGYSIQLKWTKTLQYREKTLEVFMPSLPSASVNPAEGIEILLTLHSKIASDKAMSPFICVNAGEQLKYSTFIGVVNYVLGRSGTSDKLTGHSFHRGGATWAFEIGIPGELIQDIGFWKSNAYLQYIEMNVDYSDNRNQAQQIVLGALRNCSGVRLRCWPICKDPKSGLASFQVARSSWTCAGSMISSLAQRQTKITQSPCHARRFCPSLRRAIQS